MIKNYVMCRGILPLRRHFIYVDSEPWLADRVFIRNGLKVHFGEVFSRDDMKCSILTMWVWAWQAKRAEECFEEVARLALVSGRDGYEEACELLQMLEGQARRVDEGR